MLALSGINAMLIERGTDIVLYRTFRDFGYSDAEIRDWLTLPAHQNWQLMGNLCCFNGPISSALLRKRVASAQRIVARLRELGITPVLPGFYGIVPATSSAAFPDAHVIPQGEWAGFTRPDWLDPRDPMFARLASAFYRHQRELFGDSRIYDMEVFQEGGDSGDVPVAAAARAVQDALLAAHPGASWMMLAWQGNPRQELLAGVDRSRLLIVDIDHDRVPRDDRAGTSTARRSCLAASGSSAAARLSAPTSTTSPTRLQRLGHANPNMAGTALFTEGMDTNPFAFDLFTEMAWRSEPVELSRWTQDYAARRYGAADPHATPRLAGAAGHRLRHPHRRGGFQQRTRRGAGIAVQRAAQSERCQWPRTGRRRPCATTPTPSSRRCRSCCRPRRTCATATLRPGGHRAPDAGQRKSRAAAADQERLRRRQPLRFEALTQRWLQLMDLQDELLSTDRAFLVGTWLKYVRSLGRYYRRGGAAELRRALAADHLGRPQGE